MSLEEQINLLNLELKAMQAARDIHFKKRSEELTNSIAYQDALLSAKKENRILIEENAKLRVQLERAHTKIGQLTCS